MKDERRNELTGIDRMNRIKRFEILDLRFEIST
jgi:hypothetical protein